MTLPNYDRVPAFDHIQVLKGKGLSIWTTDPDGQLGWSKDLNLAIEDAQLRITEIAADLRLLQEFLNAQKEGDV